MSDPLALRLEEIARQAELTHLAVAFHDLETGYRFEHQGRLHLHAASTFKVAVLLALLKAVADGPIRLADQLQVRNRFRSIYDGAPFRVDRERDGDSEVHRHLGRSLPLGRLARAMIVRSSNLATNLLIDFLTPKFVRATLTAAGVEGVEVRRGVEDLAAHEHGLNNEVSAIGLVALFQLFLESAFLPEELRAEGLAILSAQEFNGMIPAGLPAGIPIAHKTGEISTHAHDAGIVLPPGRRPYLLAILTESAPNQEGRPRAVAKVSSLIFEHLKESHT